MRLYQTVAGLRASLGRYWQRKKIGLVPTMGALHPGHKSLIEAARQENDVVVVSIYVNPLQFAPGEDLERYPRNLDQDSQICEELGVDVVFAPTWTEMTGNPLADSSPTFVIPPNSMMNRLCGAFRPGHFQGVATIVSKLLNLVQPDRAYFGQKDAQQLAIIRRLVQDLNIPVEIRAGDIVREESGLAYSSRNAYLSPEEKQDALLLSQGLNQAQAAFQAGERDSQTLVKLVQSELGQGESVTVQYVELVHPDTIEPLTMIKDVGLLAIAAHVGKTRLIDNVVLRHRQPIIAIDGPAGVGKSTIAQKIAQTRKLVYLDTGAMYRAVTWQVLQGGIAVEDEAAIAELTSQSQIQFTHTGDQQRVLIDGEDVTQVIRSPEVTANVSAVSKHQGVRRLLVQQQQKWGKQGGLVAEGRDIGTYVFPHAEVKVFLTASVQERARRRLLDLKQQGYGLVFQEKLEQQIQERDRLDSTRNVSPLRKASDAVEIQTDGLSIEEVTKRILTLLPES
ncbi:bifunctional pantoate--beta-alanine ligase/(d)CMP kinase [Spirulina sp. CS-785/01]|uniref:bifunctional pantoate--beta-alanine ligase/(d)CMP kinase n=1 Tax=Spirulina sp. CS-785/01 TaxID=3021716 RepID=UPI002330F8E1|nr:bifunctional pantoate--beta-alanine ligase/(d)CMP kinase [Spirulina sp. CS-785/01]MDB9311472.1 bifunctional pantoate--beta-alanine ligase/(d)CMP kinase [Spirulina sp. CS-785/01]